MPRVRRPPSQGGETFLQNQADGIAAIDLFVVPTMSFRLLFGLLILRHDRREILWFGATEHPTAEWIARQLTEAFGWEMPPRYLEQVPAVLNQGIPIGRGWAESWRLIRLAEARHAHIVFVGFAGTGDRSG